MEGKERLLKKLETPEGIVPFDDWYFGLRDKKTKAIIAARLLRIQVGNLGDVKSIGEGVFEFRINFGSGFRIYFGEAGNTIVVLICAGDKSTQERDIQIAITLWEKYRGEIDRYSRDI
jgi:putative addiction module killer protein